MKYKENKKFSNMKKQYLKNEKRKNIKSLKQYLKNIDLKNKTYYEIEYINLYEKKLNSNEINLYIEYENIYYENIENDLIKLENELFNKYEFLNLFDIVYYYHKKENENLIITFNENELKNYNTFYLKIIITIKF